MKKWTILLFIIITLTNSACLKDDNNFIVEFIMYPNPYSAQAGGNATFRVRCSQLLNGASLTIQIMTFNGEQVWTSTTIVNANPMLVLWGGKNNNGITIAPGVYLAKANINGSTSGEREIKIMVQ